MFLAIKAYISKNSTIQVDMIAHWATSIHTRVHLAYFSSQLQQIHGFIQPLSKYASRVNAGRSVGHHVHLDRRVLADVRFDRQEHYPGHSATQLRCANCRGKSKYKCTKCNVGLHIECFANYHTV